MKVAGSKNTPLNIAIIGCGKIADDHVWSIRAEGSDVVAVCDHEELMARQLADRFKIGKTFVDVGTMLRHVGPDVVHITTPPQSHFPLAKQCLEWGASVYVEKPFTRRIEEAAELIGLAQRQGLVLTVGHDRQFCQASRRMRSLIGAGYLGSKPVHMESYYGYDLGYGAYAKALLADQQHWVRALPGRLLHNIISHGVARLAEYLETDHPQVVTVGFVSPQLRDLGESEIVDEIRVIISENRRTTAYLTVSSQARPLLNQFNVYGTKNGLSMDQQKQTVIRHKGKAYPSYAEQFIPSLSYSGQYLANFFQNLSLFLKSRFHQKQSMRFLTENFYEAVRGNAEPPIPYREIMLTTRIMDTIFQQLYQDKPQK